MSPLDFTKGAGFGIIEMKGEAFDELKMRFQHNMSHQTQTDSKNGTFRKYKTIQETSERSDSVQSPCSSSMKQALYSGDVNPARNLDEQFIGSH